MQFACPRWELSFLWTGTFGAVESSGKPKHVVWGLLVAATTM